MPGMSMNMGRPAPEPINTASKPCSSINSSTVMVRPTTVSVAIVTPSAFKPSTSFCTMALGRRNSGMPYTSTPPARCSASKTVTSYPLRARSPAQVRPEGPEPTTATRWPLEAGFSGAAVACSRCQSATKRSRRPMPTGSPLMPRTQCFSHWLSCGQTRPQTAGSAEVAAMI